MYSVKKLGLTESNPDSISSFIGSPLHLYFEAVHNLHGELMDNAIKFYREYYSVKGQFENELYTGIPELLRELHSQEKNLYLVTSKPTVYAESILSFFNLRELFKNIYGSDLSNYNSSKTVLIKKLLKAENLKPVECVMIGDRMHDIIGAKDNNIGSIAVTYGFGSAEELRENKPTILIDSVTRFRNIFL